MSSPDVLPVTSTTGRRESVRRPTGGRFLRPGHVLGTLGATGVMYGVGLGFVIQQNQGVEGIWAPLSDVGAAIFGLSLVPLVGAIAAEMEHAGVPRQARGVGLCAAGLITAGSAWLVAGSAGLVPDAGAAGLAVQMIGLGVLGVWLTLVGVRTLRTGRWSRVAGWAAVVAGLGYVAGDVVAALQMFDSPLFALVYGATIVGFVTWLVALLRSVR